jgi:hypothetical protein
MSHPTPYFVQVHRYPEVKVKKRSWSDCVILELSWCSLRMHMLHYES